MFKGLIRTYNQAGTFFVTIEQNISEHGDIAFFAYIVPPQGYHTWGIVNLFQPNFIPKVTLLYYDYFLHVLCIYKYKGQF